MGSRMRRWALLGLCWLAFGVRLLGLDFQSLWRDEVDALRFAGRPWGDLLQTFASPGQNGPLYYLLLRPWLDLAGQSEFALRFFSVAFGVLAVPLLYRLGRRLFPSVPLVALIASLLAAISPYLVWYSQEGKMYALVVVLVLLSMDRFLAAAQQGGWQRWAGYVVVTTLALYVHLLTVLIIPVQVVSFFVLARRGRTTQWRPWLVSLALLSLPYLPLLAWQLPWLIEPAETGYRFVPLHEMLISLLPSYSLGVAQGRVRWATALFVGALAAVGLFRTARRSRYAGVTILVLWFLLPVAGLFLITLVRPLYTARYLIFVLPAYLLLLAVGIVALGRRAPVLAGVLLAAFVGFSIWGIWRQAVTPIKADFRAATAYLTSRLTPGDLILFQIPYGRHSFDYYSRRLDQLPQPAREETVANRTLPVLGGSRALLPLMARSGAPAYRWAEGVYTNSGIDPGQVDQLMTEMVEGSDVVWLVATEVPMWDERGLVQAWLAEHALLAEEAQFIRVAVYRYEIP